MATDQVPSVLPLLESPLDSEKPEAQHVETAAKVPSTKPTSEPVTSKVEEAEKPEASHKHDESVAESKSAAGPEVTKTEEAVAPTSEAKPTTEHEHATNEATLDPTYFDIPKTCKAGVVCNEGPDFHLEVQDIEVPEIGPDDVLIRMNCTGICLSDVHAMLNDWGTPKMSSMGTRCAGHEGAGVIVKVGERVSTLKVGMRAGIKPILDTCGSCEYCRTGNDTYCLKALYCGAQVDGSFKQYVRSPARYTTLIPDGIPDHIAGPVMCSTSTIYTSLKESKLRPGQWAVFPGGGGGVGIQGVQLAVAMGIRPIVVDTGDERRKMTLAVGAEAFIDFAKKEEDPVAEVLKLTGGGAHAVFVTAVQSYPIALDYLGHRFGGQVMCIGLPPAGKFHMDVFPSRLIFRKQSIKGTLVSGLADVDEALEFARRGKITFKPTVVGLSRFNEAVQLLKEGKVAGRMVVDFNLP